MELMTFQELHKVHASLIMLATTHRTSNRMIIRRNTSVGVKTNQNSIEARAMRQLLAEHLENILPFAAHTSLLRQMD